MNVFVPAKTEGDGVLRRPQLFKLYIVVIRNATEADTQFNFAALETRKRAYKVKTCLNGVESKAFYVGFYFGVIG